MIVVKVELHSAVTGEIVPLGTAVIDNVGGTRSLGNYRARVWRKGFDPIVNRLRSPVTREGRVYDHARLSLPVWTLVRKALEAMDY